MAPFTLRDEEEYRRLDWQILKNGAISLYVDQEVLRSAEDWFRTQAYQLYIFDATRWKSEPDFYDEALAKLGLAEHCRHPDALLDCLAYLDVPYDSGTVLIFQHFESFAHKEPLFTQSLLDVIQITSRDFSLRGCRLLALVQMDDLNATFKSVGACPIKLNPVEFGMRLRRQRVQPVNTSHKGSRKKNVGNS